MSEESRVQPLLAGARVLRICCGRRSGRLAGHELLRVDLPITKELIGVEKQHGADGRLIEPADARGARNGRLVSPGIFHRQVNLRQTPIYQGHVDLHEEEEASKRAALEQTRLGLLGLGDCAPYNALILGERAPPGGDSAESPAHRDLSGGAGVERDKGSVAILAIAVALPHSVPTFSRLRNVEDSHN